VEFTSKEAADGAGLHQRTVIKWSEEGLVVPSEPRRKYEPRKYSEQDLAALMLAKAALFSDIPREDVAEMVKMVQKSDEKQQKNAAIICTTGIDEWDGFVDQRWIPNVKGQEADEEIGVILLTTSLYDLVQWRLELVHQRHASLTRALTRAKGENDIS
jgi:DNA-binding transcriptional MerR regulator